LLKLLKVLKMRGRQGDVLPEFHVELEMNPLVSFMAIDRNSKDTELYAAGGAVRSLGQGAFPRPSHGIRMRLPRAIEKAASGAAAALAFLEAA
jgi:hypothetical protein